LIREIEKIRRDIIAKNNPNTIHDKTIEPFHHQHRSELTSIDNGKCFDFELKIISIWIYFKKSNHYRRIVNFEMTLLLIGMQIL